MATTGNAATRAETAADVALKATGIAVEAKKQAERHAETAERLAPPDPHQEIIRELAWHEQSGLLNIGPKRNRWSELQAFDEQLVEIERRREELRHEIGALMVDRNNEPTRVAAALDGWLIGGQQGERPTSQAAALDQRIADLEAELGASAIAHDRLLRERAAHVDKNRRKMLADMRDEIEATASEYRAFVDQLEQTRRDLLELRQTEIWVAIYPSHTLANEPNTQALVGARRRCSPSTCLAWSRARGLRPLQPVTRRRRFCESVATVEQAALEQGVSVGRLRKSDARWMDNTKQDLVGPAFASTWGGQRRGEGRGRAVRDYQEQTKRRLWGDG